MSTYALDPKGLEAAIEYQREQIARHQGLLARLERLRDMPPESTLVDEAPDGVSESDEGEA